MAKKKVTKHLKAPTPITSTKPLIGFNQFSRAAQLSGK
jgi:hypothetical protein